MRFLLTILAAFVLSIQANAQQTEWNLVFPSHKSPPMAIKDIAPLDSLHAFIVGDFPRIGYTADGGKSWQYTTINAPESDSAADFTSIHFTDAQHGWAASGASGIARTINGGATWQWGDGAFKNISSIMTWKDMTFVDSLNGWAVGSWDSANRYHPMMARTSDGGNTWVTLKIDSIYREFISCAFLNKNIGIATGGCNWVFRTSDGGVSWKMMLPIGKLEVENYVSIMPDSSFAICNPNGMLISKDKGLTWILDSASILKSYKTISFADSLHGISVKPPLSYQSPYYLITNDGGKTWIPKAYPLEVSRFPYGLIILSCATAPDGSIWLSNDRGMILRATDVRATLKNLTGYSDVFNRITFNSTLSGWLSITNKRNLLLHTLDGGKSWVPQFQPDTLTYITYGPFFLDENVRWYIAHEKGGTMLVKTTDNGVTWTKIPGYIPDPSYFLYPINDSVLLIAYHTPGPPAWNISTDGGQSWKEFKDLYTYRNINISHKIGIVSGTYGRIITSLNGGLTWRHSILPPPLDSLSIFTSCILDSNTWWVGGGRGTLALSRDGGKTWNDYTSKFNRKDCSIQHIEFSDAGIGVLTTVNSKSISYIFVSTNGGESWTQASIEPFDLATTYIMDFTLASDGTFWACGDNGMLINWKPSVTSVEELPPAPINDGISIYPNPASTSLTVSGIDGISSIRIVNSLGVEVMSTQTVNATQEIDVSSLPSGLYFVNARSSSGMVVKPVIIDR